MTEYPTVLMPITGAFHTGGGIATLNRLVIHTLVESNYRVEILAFTEDVDSIDRKYGDEQQIDYKVFSGHKFAFIVEVWRRLFTKRYTYILCDHVNIAAALSPISFLFPYCVWLCGIEVWPPVINWEGKLGLLGASQRLAISEYTATRVQQQFHGLDIDVCELAVDPIRSNFRDINKETNLLFEAIAGNIEPLGAQVILLVGRMAEERYKGHEVLINAMPQILSRHSNAQLFLVGNGIDYPRLKQIAKALPTLVQHSIFLPGFVSDEHLSRLLLDCYMFAMPSMGEGFGFVYIEAMNCGKPCIGSRVDAAGCIIEDGKTGLLVHDPTSVDEVAACINDLLDNPEKARAFGEAGKARVLSRYLFPHFKERFWKALEG